MGYLKADITDQQEVRGSHMQILAQHFIIERVNISFNLLFQIFTNGIINWQFYSFVQILTAKLTRRQFIWQKPQHFQLMAINQWIAASTSL